MMSPPCAARPLKAKPATPRATSNFWKLAAPRPPGGETHEYPDMKPGMARTAREEGHEEIADWFETLAKAERSHAGRFQRALDELK